ncbi:MAG: PDZ domain-containing protein [Candidatus Liptonbacteria bacterium]|nr:PDZ domain-containing protein [Candidatus Liptonbacteria bacterium]
MKLSLNINWRVIGGVILGMVIITAVAGGGFYYGFRYGAREPREVVLDLKNVNATSTSGDFNTFWQAWQIVKKDALHGEKLTDQDLLYGAIRGLVNSLKDPHSVYLPPQEAKKFSEDISGSFGGVGMEIGKRNGELVVIAPLKNTPAEKAGLQPNDYIMKIGDTFTDVLDVDEAVNLIRGPKGTEVKLLIAREGLREAKEFKIVRGDIVIPTIELEMLGLTGASQESGGIAHISLYNFNEKAPELFYGALVEAEEKGASGIILDLRNNPGGYLEVAVNIAGWWLDKGTLVVSEKFRDGENGEDFKSPGNAVIKKWPTVVLINGGSASASEILAGALRDQLGLKLIGEKSFGKGTVQTLRELTDGSNIKITVASWVLPSGVVIEGNGLAPDIEIKITDKDIEAGKDPQLEKALATVGAM